jgi:hypothetical protein
MQNPKVDTKKCIKSINTFTKSLSNWEKQALKAKVQMELFQKILLKNLSDKNFKVKIIHDSIFIEKDKKTNESKYTENT